MAADASVDDGSTGQWPVAVVVFVGANVASNKAPPKQRRRETSLAERATLEAAFSQAAFLSPARNETLADSLGWDAARVRIWFANRRRKETTNWRKNNPGSSLPSHLVRHAAPYRTPLLRYPGGDDKNVSEHDR